MKKPFLWAVSAGVATSLLLVSKKASASAGPVVSGSSKTYGETTRVVLTVPPGWRRATNADVAALPELREQANALRSAPGFTSMRYGTLIPFVASDGGTYATWVEQHYHEPEGPVKPWGFHHGVTLLAQT